MITRNALISTVGTSLLEGNVRNLTGEAPGAPENWRELRGAYEKEDWEALATELLKIPPAERVMGAEINTIEQARKKHWLSLEHLVFLVSDTPSGRNTGRVLREYFGRREDLGLKSVEYAVINELQDERPTAFKVQGLRNMVREAGRHVQRHGGPERVAFDATGGYKAQTAIAVLLGQALGVPVFYKHERFAETIDFPPLPVSFDYGVLGNHAELLTDLERGKVVSSGEVEVDERLRPLLEEVTLEGETLYDLSPVGGIYLVGFRNRNPEPVDLVEAKSKEPPHFPGGQNFPEAFRDFVEKVCRETDWVVTGRALHYGLQDAIGGVGFHVSHRHNPPKLVGIYQDQKSFGGTFLLELTDESFPALTWAAVLLNQRYRGTKL